MTLKIKFLFILFFVLSIKAFAQYEITGQFPPVGNQQVKLIGFQGFETYTIDSTVVSQEGEFTLKFDKKDFGMGYLLAEDNTPYLVVLAEENSKLNGVNFDQPKTVKTIMGKENRLFEQDEDEQPSGTQRGREGGGGGG